MKTSINMVKRGSSIWLIRQESTGNVVRIVNSEEKAKRIADEMGNTWEQWTVD